MIPERKEEIREGYRRAELAARFRPGGLGHDLRLIGELLVALDEAEKHRHSGPCDNFGLCNACSSKVAEALKRYDEGLIA